MGSVASAGKFEFLTPKHAITHVIKLPGVATALLQANVDVLEATRCTDAQSEAEQLLHQQVAARRTRGLS